MVSKYEDGKVVLSTLSDDAEEMSTLLLNNALPLVGERTKENDLVLFSNRPLLVVFLDVSWERELKKGTVWSHTCARTILCSIQKKKTC